LIFAEREQKAVKTGRYAIARITDVIPDVHDFQSAPGPIRTLNGCCWTFGLLHGLAAAFDAVSYPAINVLGGPGDSARTDGDWCRKFALCDQRVQGRARVAGALDNGRESEKRLRHVLEPFRPHWANKHHAVYWDSVPGAQHEKGDVHAPNAFKFKMLWPT
jgi:hypothetical protein